MSVVRTSAESTCLINLVYTTVICQIIEQIPLRTQPHKSKFHVAFYVANITKLYQMTCLHNIFLFSHPYKATIFFFSLLLL